MLEIHTYKTLLNNLYLYKKIKVLKHDSIVTILIFQSLTLMMLTILCRYE